MSGAHGIGLTRRAQHTAITAAMLVALAGASAPALASFGGGSIRIPPWMMFFIGGIFATPGAVVVAVIEWVGARRQPPAWVAVASMMLAVVCFTIALGLGGRADSGWYLLPVPPLMMLALAALFPRAGPRLAAVWTVSLLAFAATTYTNVRFGTSARHEVTATIAGGACFTLLLWQLTWWLRKVGLENQARKERARNIPAATAETGVPAGEVSARIATPAPTTGARPPAALAYEVDSLRRGAAAATRRIRGLHSGVRWWLLGALLFYVGMAAASAAGVDTLLEAIRRLEWHVFDLFNWPTGTLEAIPLRMWATHGLVWSALFGCGTWGAAAVAGRFDAGPLQALRFAGVAASVIMLLAIAMTASQIRI